MSNHEEKPKEKSVHLFLAFTRKKDGEKNRKCIRTIIRDYDTDLSILEAKLKVIGGTWRIHKTINARDVEKASKWPIKDLIDYPEHAIFLDSLWRTALLQKSCIYGEKKWLIDVDFSDSLKVSEFENFLLDQRILVYGCKIKTPNGYHYIVKPFDRRILETYQNVSITIIQDGYYFVKRIGI